MILLLFSLFLFVPPLIFARKIPAYYLIWTVILILIYIIVSYINASFYVFSPLWRDAGSFYKYMVHVNQNPDEAVGLFFPGSGGHALGYWYASQVSYLYQFTNSIIAGQSASILGYSCSTVLLYFFVEKLSLEYFSVPILLFFSLQPMHLIDSVGCLRESWELFFFMLSVWSIIGFIEHRKRGVNLLLLWFSLFMGSRLHYVFDLLAFPAVVVLGLSLFKGSRLVKLKHFNQSIAIKISWVIALVVVCGCVCALIVLIYGPIIEDELLRKYSILIRIVANTTYVDPLRPFDIFTPLILFVNYMFYPFPWNIHNPTDFFAFLCVGLRSVLLYSAIRGAFLNEGQGHKKTARRVVLYSCLVIAFIFSQGVSNYGTAFRHQILTYWGLVLVGLPGIIVYLKSTMARVNTPTYLETS
jgi:hypothetical protein